MTTPYTTLARATRAKSSVTFDHLLSASEHIDGAVGWKSLLRTYRGIEVFLRSDLPYLAIGPVNQLESIVTVEGETIEGSVSPSGDSIVLVDAPAGVTQATVTGDIGLGTLVPAGVLVGAIDAFTRDVDVDAVRPGNSFRIDREMLVRNNEHETIRGAGGTVAAPHADGADVWIVGAPALLQNLAAIVSVRVADAEYRQGRDYAPIITKAIREDLRQAYALPAPPPLDALAIDTVTRIVVGERPDITAEIVQQVATALFARMAAGAGIDLAVANGVLTISALAAPPAVLEGAFALQAEEARPDTATWLAATHVDGNDEEWLYILPSQTRVAGGGWVWVAATAPLTQIGFSPGDNQIGGFAARVEIDLNGVVYHTYRSNSDLVDLESRALPLYLSIAE